MSFQFKLEPPSSPVLNSGSSDPTPSSARGDDSSQRLSTTTETSVPPTAPPKSYTGTAKRYNNIRYEDFFESSPEPAAPPVTPPGALLPKLSALVAQKLQKDHDRFARQTSTIGMSSFCCATDRAEVIALYNEAMNRVGEWEVQQDASEMEPTHSTASLGPFTKEELEQYNSLLEEVQSKTKVILGLAAADPEDDIFSANQILSPLEPMYANPRIDMRNDMYRHRAAQRLKDWRAEGWPDKFPAKACAAEAEERLWDAPDVELSERLEHRRKGWMTEDWGEEVDAEKECWDEEDWEKRQRQKKKAAKKRRRE